MGRRAKQEIETFAGGMDRLGEERRAERRKDAARVAQKQTQARHERRLVDCGTSGRQGRGGRYAEGLPKSRGPIRRGTVCRTEREASAGLRWAVRAWQ